MTVGDDQVDLVDEKCGARFVPRHQWRREDLNFIYINFSTVTMGIFERNEYIPHGNELVPYEITFMRIGNEFIPTLCWNLHKPKPPKIKTFLMEKVS